MRWIVCLLLVSSVLASEPTSPLTPEQSLAAMRVNDGLEVQIAATEPQVQDPVAICWDAAGAMYVAEMGDYRALPTGGRIKRLVDADGERTAKSIAFLNEQERGFVSNETPAEKARHMALANFCHMLLSSNEFLYVE